MRTLALLSISASLLLAACTQDPKESPQYQQLSEDIGRSQAEIAEKDSMINDLFGTVNRISENLRIIRSKQGQLGSGDGGSEGENVEERIMGDIQSIDGLLAENKTLIERLRTQTKGSAKSLDQFQRTVDDLDRSISEKDQEIAQVKEQLASTNSSLATLIEMYRDKSQLADLQRNELNTAWYAVGTAKELRDKGVLTKEGGIIGIGTVDKLNTEELAKDYFTRLDITTDTGITVAAKKAKLATNHPAGSYRFEDGANKLVILDANAFWSLSKYLVVVVE